MAIYKFLKRIGLDWFILAIAACIFLAWLYPNIGIRREPLSLDDVATFGVSMVFFLYGLRLSPQKLKEGLRNVRLHFVVQFMTFVTFPLIVLFLMRFVDFTPDGPDYYQWLGIFFLATLPSTVSSSVVMVAIAGGNVPAAIFNASISSLIGVFVTPLWMSMFVNASSGGYPISDIVLKLILQVLVPIVLGLLLNKKFGAWAEAHKAKLKYSDQCTILLIIYTSFCQSFYDKMFEGHSIAHLAELTAMVIAMFFLLYFIIFCVSRLMKFNRKDTITALFCGSKKSLVHGSVMSNVIFSNSAIAGVVLLPTMLYHAAQLVIVSAIASAMAKKSEELERLASDS